MSYWKSKVVPKLKKLFDKGGAKKKGAALTCKQFDSSKESLEKEIGEKTTDLSPKVIEIYRSSTFISKKLLKEPSESAVKENSDAAQSILQELTTAGFPGAQTLSDAGKKYGPALLTGPIVYLFGKTSTFLVEEPLPEPEPEPEPEQETREITIESIAEEKTKEPEALPEGEVVNPPQPDPVAPVGEIGVSSEEKKEVVPIVSSEEKKEVVPIVEGKKEEPTPIVEAKKEDSIPAIEPTKTEVAPTEAKHAEVAPTEAKKEVTPPIEAKKEEMAASKDDKKEPAAAAKEVKKEEVATPSEVKKEEVVAIPPPGKKEEVVATPPPATK